MIEQTASLLEILSSKKIKNLRVIPWASPVPVFGNISISKVATLGLNPSNLEFVDDTGIELDGLKRRFHTLKSLGINSWNDANTTHVELINTSCTNYFSGNPYDFWFKKLDKIISGTGLSYYFPSGQACHLDLVPYATECKWSELTGQQRQELLNIGGDTLGSLIQNSPIEVLILNGQTVIDNFSKISAVKFDKIQMNNWSLPRKIKNVYGYSYIGWTNKIGDISLDREILILGYNHNIQSSYGVTTDIQNSIRSWVTENINEKIYETA